MAKKKVEEDERRRARELVELQKEKTKLALENEQLNEKLISVQESFVSHYFGSHYITHTTQV